VSCLALVALGAASSHAKDINPVAIDQKDK